MKTLFKKHFFIPLLLIIGGLGFTPSSRPIFIFKSLIPKVMIKDTVKKTSVVLAQVLLKPTNVLYIRDTTDMAGLSKVIGADYGEIFTFIGRNGLKPGKVMAFYLNYQDPVTLEPAVEVDRVPEKLTGRIKSKMIAGGDAIVAHYTGPYEEMELPYNEIAKWLKENNQEARELPFEVYLNEPAQVKDKYELKTDVYQLLK